MARSLLCFAGLVLLAGNVALAGPSDDLEAARSAYYDGRYRRAIRRAQKVIRRDEATREQRLEAYKYVAFSSFLRGDKDAARVAWEALLRLVPAYKVDPVEVSPELLAFFSGIDPPLARSPPQDAPEPETAPDPEPTPEPPPERPPEPRPEPVELVTAAPVSERGCGLYLCAVPFGVGQWMNDEKLKAGIFAGAELLFLVTNIGLYWYNKLEFERNDYFADETAAERRHTAQQVFFGLFAVALVGGIVDAYLFP